MNIPLIFWVVPAASVLALAFAWGFFRNMMKADEGTDTMKRIAKHVRKGANAYLRQQYKIVGYCFISNYNYFQHFGIWPWHSKPVGTICIYHRWCIFRSCRLFWYESCHFCLCPCCQCMSHISGQRFRLAFRSGAVMGLVVVGLVLLDISLWYCS
jgi:K(+)-stimulated pyrophosphate-energized sodium pump